MRLEDRRSAARRPALVSTFHDRTRFVSRIRLQTSAGGMQRFVICRIRLQTSGGPMLTKRLLR